MNISTILNIFSTFAAGGMCCIRCKQKCFVLAQKAVKEVTFVLLFQRERGWASCLWRNDEGQEGVHWHEDQPLDHQLTRRVVLNLSLATDRLLTDGRWWLFTMDFRCLFLLKIINFLSTINLPPTPFVPLWVINENEEAIRSEEPLISLDLLWIRNLWPCVIYILYHNCHVLLTQFSTQRNTIAHFLWGIVMLRLSRKSATICVFLDQVQAFNPTFCEQPIKLQTKSYKDRKREEQSYTTHLDDKVKTFFP